MARSSKCRSVQMARLGSIGGTGHQAKVKWSYRNGLWKLRVIPTTGTKLDDYELRLSGSLVGVRMDRMGWMGLTTIGEPVFLRRLSQTADCRMEPRAAVTHLQLVADRQVRGAVRAGGTFGRPELPVRGMRVPGEGAKLEARVGPMETRLRLGDTYARKLTIENTGSEAIDFDSRSGQLDIIHQAMAPDGRWVAIETPAMRVAGFVCGMSQPIMVLPHRKRWTILLPVYDGSLKTQLRIRVRTPLGNLYSKPFEGSIEPEQLSL